MLTRRALELNLHITQDAIDKLPVTETERRRQDKVKIRRAGGLLDLPSRRTPITDSAKMPLSEKTFIGEVGDGKVNFSSVIDSDVTGKPTSSAFLNLETDASLGLEKRRDDYWKSEFHTGRSLFQVASKEERLPPQPGSLLVAHPLLDDGFLYRAGECVYF